MYYTRRTLFLCALACLILGGSPLLSRMADGLFAAPFSSEQTPSRSMALVGAKPKTASAPDQPFPALRAESVFIGDIDTGQTLYEHAGATRYPIASLTKIMTAALFEEYVPLSGRYAITPDAKSTEPKKSPVPAGMFVSGTDMIKLMMIDSANDSARAAAEKIGTVMNVRKRLPVTFDQTFSSAITAMNEKAVALGMNDTNFVNPVGFDDPRQYSTARDLFALIRYTFSRHRDMWIYSRSPSDTIGYTDVDEAHSRIATIQNTDPLVRAYPRIIGSKTGTTDDAKEALVLLYQLTNGRHIAMIILRSSDRFSDAEKIIQWLDDGHKS